MPLILSLVFPLLFGCISVKNTDTDFLSMSLSSIQECHAQWRILPDAWFKRVLKIKFKSQYIQGTKHVLNVGARCPFTCANLSVKFQCVG